MPHISDEEAAKLQKQLTQHVLELAEQHKLDAEECARMMVFSCGELLYVHSNEGVKHSIEEAFESIIEIAEEGIDCARSFNAKNN